VGIVRVERELIKWACAHEDNCIFMFFDGDTKRYRAVENAWLKPILEGRATVDTTGMKDPSRSRPRKSERVPRLLLGPFLWVTQFRRMALRTLGGFALQSGSPIVPPIARLLMRIIAGAKYSGLLGWSGATQAVLVSANRVLGPEISFKAGDRILFAGANWIHSNASYIADQKKSIDLELITLCYDIIPLQHPHFFKAHDIEMLRRHFQLVFSISSLILVTSEFVSLSIRDYCNEHRIPINQVRTTPLGFDVQSDSPERSQRKIISQSKYILFVSTIEPRKGHRMVASIWGKLLAEGIPQRVDAALVLVGRPGWMVDDLVTSLSMSERVLIFDNANDAELIKLYDGASFCVYPSVSEGYGLPVVEALSRRRPVLASNVGIVPELQCGGLLKRLAPQDETAWFDATREWLLTPPNPKCADDFHHPTWQEAASVLFAKVRADILIEGTPDH
jgi:glycosyltransferase involved in cell wall biosynthesis